MRERKGKEREEREKEKGEESSVDERRLATDSPASPLSLSIRRSSRLPSSFLSFFGLFFTCFLLWTSSSGPPSVSLCVLLSCCVCLCSALSVSSVIKLLGMEGSFEVFSLEDDEAEHSVEMQLPFLHFILIQK